MFALRLHAFFEYQFSESLCRSIPPNKLIRMILKVIQRPRWQLRDTKILVCVMNKMKSLFIQLLAAGM